MASRVSASMVCGAPDGGSSAPTDSTVNVASGIATDDAPSLLAAVVKLGAVMLLATSDGALLAVSLSLGRGFRDFAPLPSVNMPVPEK